MQMNMKTKSLNKTIQLITMRKMRTLTNKTSSKTKPLKSIMQIMLKMKIKKKRS